ncbi:hypothetical protein C8Q73DRAFT_792119 [Cubamyces lactineus]|nr:hypothetical protein C8Q73DRAFT_792119 [Cubamyces lactineus]
MASEYNHQNAMLRFLAALRDERQRVREYAAHLYARNESGSLNESVQAPGNPPAHLDDPSLSPSEAAADVYDDLPPLEDDVQSSSRNVAPPSPATSRRYPGDFNSFPAESSPEEDELPPLETMRLSSPSPPSRPLELGTSVAGPSSIRLGHSLDSNTLSTDAAVSSSPTVATPRSRFRARSTNDIDTGAESDSSMPTLRTVSDSDEESDTFDDSESDWDMSSEYPESEGGSARYQATAPLPPRTGAQRTSPLSTDLSPYPSPPPRLGMLPSLEVEVLSDDGEEEDFFEIARRTESLYRRYNDGVLESRESFSMDLVAYLTEQSTSDGDRTRAATLLTGMEPISEDLIHRYEALRKVDGEDAEECAICRDDLFDKSPDATRAAEFLSVCAALPFHSGLSAVIAFPCPGKHLFHTDCISPWLERKTTCPSCRFDIDPLSLTLHKTPGLMHRNDVGVGLGDSRVWQPPQVQSMREWLDAEEQARATGVPRERPEVIMPTYPPAPIPARTESRHSLADFLDATDPVWDYNPANVEHFFRNNPANYMSEEERETLLTALREVEQISMPMPPVDFTVPVNHQERIRQHMEAVLERLDEFDSVLRPPSISSTLSTPTNGFVSSDLAPDGGEAPPPIQADPNQALQAVAPMAHEEYSYTLSGPATRDTERDIMSEID